MTLHKQSFHEGLNDCPIRDVLNRLSDRWTVLVMSQLRTGVQRFGEIRREIPDISPRMLSQTLRNLEQDGLVTRMAYPTIPPRVDYHLTEMGQSFLAVVDVMLVWAKANQPAIHSARAAYVAPSKIDTK